MTYYQKRSRQIENFNPCWMAFLMFGEVSSFKVWCDCGVSCVVFDEKVLSGKFL
jgi:hypothetical protein